MKPPAFDYCAPESLDEALTLLAEYGEDARPLAGGQSLTPMLALRLVRPTALIDLNRVPDLDIEAVDPQGGDLHLGAMLRTARLERASLVASHQPLLAEAAHWIAHGPIRNRGTIGGSLSHADPSAELPALAVALDARMRIAGPTGVREVPAGSFFHGMFETDIAPGEILTEIVFPKMPRGRQVALHEIARRHGDFAMAGLAVAFGGGPARAVGFGLTDCPVRLPMLEALLGSDGADGPVPAAEIAEAARADVAGFDLNDDLHASAAWRADVLPVIARRAVAAARAAGDRS